MIERDDAASGPSPALPGEGPLALFGENLAAVTRYVELLETEGVLRGLIGPREVPRLWERHILNCAVVGELIARDTEVVDVGSGAGLPGIPLAIARPDLRVTLVEPMLRRTTFLDEVVSELSLGNVTVVRARAEDYRGPLAPVVTARAVAPLDRLARWCLPLVRKGGELLAMKGSSAADEMETHRRAVRKAGGGEMTLVHCGSELLETPATVVRVQRR